LPFEPLIGPPAHAGRFRREVFAVKRAPTTADTPPEAVSPVDGSLVRRLARGGVHETVALPASEIPSTKYPASAAPTLQAHEPLPTTAELSCSVRERYELVDVGLRAVPARDAVKEAHAVYLRSQTDLARALVPMSSRAGHFQIRRRRPLHKALQRAVNNDTLARNVASAIRPPKVEVEEVEILDAEQVAFVLRKLEGHPLFAISALALATGMRRGELLALRLCDTDFDVGSVRVERSLEETATGLRFKAPKSKHGRRTISLPASAVVVLRAHWRQQLEIRMALRLGKPDPDSLLFSNPEGSPLSPDNLSRDWHRTCRLLGLPMVMFHALRHTHASALIASGHDVVQVSRRLGHGSPVITLRTYGHLFGKVDSAAAAAIESMFRAPGDR
jgi:integrase